MLTTPQTSSRRVRRSSVSLATLIGLALLAACTGSPVASPSPQPSPTPGGSPIDSPEPTPQPSPTPTAGGTEIDHPTGATDVILRMEQGGGFVPMGFLATQAPEFTLYGDGTFIIQPLSDPDLGDSWDGPRPRFLQGRLDPASIQDLLAFALVSGRLAEARENYRDDMIADASTTIFNINAGGVTKTVSIYALAEVAEPAGPDAVDRMAFYQLAELLRSFEDRARGGELGEIVLYEPSHYRVTLMEAWDEAPEGIAWPWEHVTPDDFAPVEEFGAPVAILPADDVAEMVDVPSGGHPGITAEFDGTRWILIIRPLLPDESPQG